MRHGCSSEDYCRNQNGCHGSQSTRETRLVHPSGLYLRISLGETPWDLYIAAGYTLLTTGILLVSGVGSSFALPFVLIVPGYALVAALFPEAEKLTWTERVSLSFALGLAVLTLLGLLLGLTALGIQFFTVVESTSVFTLGLCCAAYWRRMRLPAKDRLAAALDLKLPLWKEYNRVEKGMAIALAASLLIATATVAYAIGRPPAVDHFTEFFVLGSSGKASGYPTSLNVSEPATVLLGIANHEGAEVTYTIRTDLVGVRIQYNATIELNETVEVNRTTWSWWNTTLEDGQNWTRPYAFSIPMPGSWEIQFSLYKDGDLAASYRAARLFIAVT